VPLELVISHLRRFIVEDDAQDLVEYALLCAFIALISVAVWHGVVDLLRDRYTDFNDNTQAIWEPQDP
jgi:Flp pilus assembly pilin Flp